ncbi:hypothetical protein EDB19DRAFT_1836182 [Suillus lakei]|nr:hypothetical protein EDB19DRAFT_1836182 [Suillus lakei]
MAIGEICKTTKISENHTSYLKPFMQIIIQPPRHPWLVAKYFKSSNADHNQPEQFSSLCNVLHIILLQSSSLGAPSVSASTFSIRARSLLFAISFNFQADFVKSCMDVETDPSVKLDTVTGLGVMAGGISGVGGSLVGAQVAGIAGAGAADGTEAGAVHNAGALAHDIAEAGVADGTGTETVHVAEVSAPHIGGVLALAPGISPGIDGIPAPEIAEVLVLDAGAGDAAERETSEPDIPQVLLCDRQV